MIIVDTNVFSELLKPKRNQAVVDWLDAQVVETLYMTAISFAELRLGIECLPAGKRKDALSADVNALIANYFASRVLAFDREAAQTYGVMVAAARAVGRAISFSDGQIGAIARVHSFSVATRDTGPFMALDVPVIDPWRP
jgi:hypothetical protein